MTTTRPPLPSSPPDLTGRQRTISFVALLLAVLLASMNQTIVSTAGPAIQKALGIENSLYSWITTAYLLASTTLVPIYGKLSDLVGRKAILLLGTVVFMAGSVVCGLSSGVGMLIAGRAVQGLGGAALIGLMYAVVADLFTIEQRSRYTALIGAVFSLSTVIGSILGGYVTDHFGWHNVFFISVPLGAFALLTMLFMPPLKQRRERAPLDLVGALLLIVFSVTLLLALSLGKTTVAPGESGFLWSSWQILSLLAAAVVALISFIAVELRAADPIINIRLFRNRTFMVANVVTFLVGVVFFAATVFLPLYMVNVIGLSATNAGLTTFPLTIGLVVSSIIAGQVFARIGKLRPIIFVGGLFMMLGFVLMGYTLRIDSTQAELTWKMIIVGMGLGPVLPMLTLAIQGNVSPADIGAATGTNNFLRSLGSTIGVAFLGTLFATTLKDEIQDKVNAAKTHLPPEMRAQFDLTSSSGGKTSSSNQNFDAAKIKRDATSKLDETRVRYIAALRDHDPVAVRALLTDPKTDAKLRDVLKKGGFEGAIEAAFAEQRDLLTRAILKRDPAAITKIVNDPKLPQELKDLARGGVKTQVEAGIAHQRDLLTRALLWNDPAAVRELLASPQTPAEFRSVLSSGGVEAQVKARFDQQRALLKRALLQDDQRAVRQIANDPRTSAQLKSVFRNGGVRARVKAEFDAQRQLFTAALLRDDRGAIEKILADPRLPADFKGLFQNGGLTRRVTAGFDAQRRLFTNALRDGDAAAVAKILANPELPVNLKGLFQNGGLEAKVDAGLARQRDVLTRALRDDDPAAVRALLAAPTTPDELKQALGSGGIRAAVKRGVDAQKAAIANAVNAGDLTPLVQNTRLPRALRDALAAIPRQALATPETRAAVLEKLTAQLDASEPAAEKAAVNVALQSATAKLDAARLGALKSARQAALAEVLAGLDEQERQTLAATPRRALDKILAELAVKERQTLASAPRQALDEILAGLDAQEPSVLASAPQQALRAAFVKLDAAERRALETAPRQALSKILAGLDEQERQTLATTPKESLDQIVQKLDEAKAKVVPVIDEIGLGIKHAFTDAVSLLYRVGLAVAALALVISMFLRETSPRAVSREQIAEDELRSVEA
ncbi:DHA2 family efflux MFS transporter permease subunit [Deinococcus yavapaiensis]|uniref:EmrB/QacA subfamily drug resistance transporter n=1 Tax=Deinococcus yavapaiensis KR-236 TaxID=694435 RepID=A0A318RYW2_9DEIO|nr:DHA2 family efflux MFS transporter permease subunit [Deinococcus yavapaiensis]PYE48648.1 EmrB/QacA subfamily drug resistance transporter [Deinococcus yavapaiensis KR-236]